jgi:hypothetical protein
VKFLRSIVLTEKQERRKLEKNILGEDAGIGKFIRTEENESDYLAICKEPDRTRA